jgi:hypothetical protein
MTNPPTFDKAEDLARFLSIGSHLTVFVEGENGVGKSFLSRLLAKALGGEHIEMDEFLEPPSDARRWCRQQIRQCELQKAIDMAARPTIVEGVMTRDVINVADFDRHAVVYVKRVSFSGWNYGHDLRLSEGQIDPSGPPPRTLGREVREYHDRVRPHTLADVFFERTD